MLPNQNKKLLYIDYSQFEAGILASLSDDEVLINLYNTDIYRDLAQCVLGDGDKRSEAKILFYRFMYGDRSLSKTAKAYFLKFKKLGEYKMTIEELMVKDRRIGTIEGNYRRCGEEFPWALSHIVQSTASLIYKKALMRCNLEVPNAEFLIPMHDGSLYQIDTLSYELTKTKIEDIYKSEFQKSCQKISAKVTCSDTF